MAQHEWGHMSAFVLRKDQPVCLRLFETEGQYSAYIGQDTFTNRYGKGRRRKDTISFNSRCTNDFCKEMRANAKLALNRLTNRQLKELHEAFGYKLNLNNYKVLLTETQAGRMCCCTSRGGPAFNNTLRKHLEKSPEFEELVRAEKHQEALQFLVNMKALSPEEATSDHSKKMKTLKRMSKKLSHTQASRGLSGAGKDRGSGSGGGGRGGASGSEEGGLSSQSRQESDELSHPKSAATKHQLVSRSHARIQRSDEGILQLFTFKRVMNGTFLTTRQNGNQTICRRLREEETFNLNDGDLIDFGLAYSQTAKIEQGAELPPEVPNRNVAWRHYLQYRVFTRGPSETSNSSAELDCMRGQQGEGTKRPTPGTAGGPSAASDPESRDSDLKQEENEAKRPRTERNGGISIVQNPENDSDLRSDTNEMRDAPSPPPAPKENQELGFTAEEWEDKFLECSICSDFIAIAANFPCGHSNFCFTCATDWESAPNPGKRKKKKKQFQCPTCRKSCKLRQLTRNIQMDQLAESLIEGGKLVKDLGRVEHWRARCAAGLQRHAEVQRKESNKENSVIHNNRTNGSELAADEEKSDQDIEVYNSSEDGSDTEDSCGEENRPAPPPPGAEIIEIL